MRTGLGAACALMMCSLFAGGAEAQAIQLAQAWQAHEELDYEGALAAAREAIEEGGLGASELAEAYLLVGRCEAALRHTQKSVDAFTKALALDGSVHLPELSSPVETGPFMEARGFWIDRGDVRLDVNAREGDDAWEVVVIDPAGVAGRLLVFGDDTTAAIGERSVTDGVPIDVPFGLSTHALALADEFGNRVVELDLPTPEPVLPPPATRPAPTVQERREPPPIDQSGRRLRIAGGSTLAAGAVAIGAGVAMHMRRERLVSRWNGPECEQPNGTSRGSQCAHLRDQIDRAQRAAIGLYAAGGAALVTGLTTWAIGSKRKERRVACAPTGLGALCTARF